MRRFEIILGLLFITMVSSTLAVKASSMNISMSVPARMKWADAGTVDKENYTGQTVEYIYSKYNRNLCSEIGRAHV